MTEGRTSSDDAEIDVTVVVATWNCGRFIERALSSTLRQSGVSIEIIVVDDCSTDDTEQIVLKLSDSRIRYLRNSEQCGPAASRNRALEAARGKWIAILDADDAMKDGRLERMIQTATNLRFDCLLDQVTAVDEWGAPLGVLIPGVLLVEDIGLTEYVERNILFGSAGLGYLKPLIRRSVLSGRIQYRTDMRIGEDFALICDLLLSGARVGLSSSPDYIYTRRTSSISHRASIRDLQAMIAFDDVMMRHPRAQTDAGFKDALLRHRAALEKLSALTRLVEDYHSRNYRRFILSVIRQSGSYHFLFWILSTRIRRINNRIKNYILPLRRRSAQNEVH